MKTINFCDTSAIIKLYHNKPGSEWMEALFDDADAVLIISELTLVEFQSAVLKKLRMGEISNEAKDIAIKNFDQNCHNRFILTLLDSRIVKKAREILKKHGGNIQSELLIQSS